MRNSNAYNPQETFRLRLVLDTNPILRVIGAQSRRCPSAGVQFLKLDTPLAREFEWL